MPILTPNSYGTLAWLREHNPYHQPSGTAIGGQFAPRPGGEGAASMKPKIGGVEVRAWKAGVTKAVLGKELSPGGMKKLAEEMIADVEGLTFDVRISADVLVDYDETTGGKKQKPTIVVTWVGDDGDPTHENPEKHPTSLVRAFYRDKAGNLVVKHSSFEKNASQPAHVGKDVLRSHMHTYERLGVDRIETFANINVGTYAWAKYGFASWSVSESAELMRTLITQAEGRMLYDRDTATGQPRGRGVGIGEHEVRELRRIAASPSKTAIWEFADATLGGVKVGKALLTSGDNNGWSAYLKVKDDGSPLAKQMRERFWSYVGRTKSEKKREARTPPSRVLAVELLTEARTSRKEPGELCEWRGGRYVDAALWARMLDGDTRFFYDLRNPSERAAYRGLLPKDR